MFKKKEYKMYRVVRKGGFVYMVEGDNHSTWYNMGKDPDDPMWKEEVKEMKKKWKKKKESSD